MRLFASRERGGQEVVLQVGDEVLIECIGRAWLASFFGMRDENPIKAQFLQDSPTGDNKLLLDADTGDQAITEVNQMLASLSLLVDSVVVNRGPTYAVYKLTTYE